MVKHYWSHDNCFDCNAPLDPDDHWVYMLHGASGHESDYWPACPECADGIADYRCIYMYECEDCALPTKSAANAAE